MENNPYNLGSPKGKVVKIKWGEKQKKWIITVGCPQYVFLHDDIQRALDLLKEYYADPMKFVEYYKLNLGNRTVK